MKPSDRRHVHDDDDGDDDREDDNIENRKERDLQISGVFRVGTRVERELDGLWFPATIVAADDDDGTFELEYDEDHNRETDIALEELR